MEDSNKNQIIKLTVVRNPFKNSFQLMPKLFESHYNILFSLLIISKYDKEFDISQL